MSGQNTFGGLLREIRKQAGKTLKKLAVHMDWSVVYLSDIERNKRNPPNPGDIKKICDFFGCQVTPLIDMANKQRNRVELNIGSKDGPVTDAALMLARRWTELTEEDAREIMAILNKSEGN